MAQESVLALAHLDLVGTGDPPLTIEASAIDSPTGVGLRNSASCGAAPSSSSRRTVVPWPTRSVKYSPPEQPIEVTIKPDGVEVQVSVLDRGIGIEPDEVDRIFTTFYRSESAKRLSAGLGIGLSACRHIVALLGGTIWARPRDGGGSAFGFVIPMADPTD